MKEIFNAMEAHKKERRESLKDNRKSKAREKYRKPLGVAYFQ